MIKIYQMMLWILQKYYLIKIHQKDFLVSQMTHNIIIIFQSSIDSLEQQNVPVVNTNTIKRKTSRIQSAFVDNNASAPGEREIRGLFASKLKGNQIILQGQLDKEYGLLFMRQFSLRVASIVYEDGIAIFIYINPQLNYKKTIIHLNQYTQCKLLGKGKFIFDDRNKKKYIFKFNENNISSQQWVNLINKYIKFQDK